MTRLLMIRHGQSVANVEKFFAGHLNSPLTALGIRQAQLTAQYVFRNFKIHKVYASDLDRAFLTGKMVADLFDLPITPVYDLREIFAGDWEGKPYGLLPELFPATYQVWLTDIGNAVCDGGETVASLQKRVVNSLEEICKMNPDETIVVATHATPIRALQCHCEGKTLEQMKAVPWVTNASISSFLYDNDRFKKDFISYDAHLGELTSKLPRNC